MLENIRLSFKGIWSHKMRSFLTMLGIIIGIAAIIAIVSIIQGTNEQIKQNLVGSGDNAVHVRLYQEDYEYETEYNGIPDGVPMITKDVLEQIRRIDGVEDAAAYNSRTSADAVYYQNTPLSGGYVYGVEENYFDVSSNLVKAGRGFSAADYERFRNVAVLDEDSAQSLFQGEKPVGKTIEIKGTPFVVVGVITKRSGFEPVINSLDDYYTYMQNTSGNIYIPVTSWPVVFAYDEPQNLLIRAVDADAMAGAGQKAADLLNAGILSSDTNIQYKGQNLLEQAREIQELSQSTNMMLLWTAGISLIVGGIGVMNIMLVSVTERTQEIGLKKAVGAGKGHILLQFLTESAVLTSVGGFFGIVAGVVLAEIISRVNGTPVAISIPAAVVALLFSMAIGILFGLLPSYKAANLNPIDALRRE